MKTSQGILHACLVALLLNGGCLQSSEEPIGCDANPYHTQAQPRRAVRFLIHGRTPEIQQQIRNVWIHYGDQTVISQHTVLASNGFACTYLVRDGEDRTSGASGGFECSISEDLYEQPLLIEIETSDRRDLNHLGGLVGWIDPTTGERRWSVTIQIIEDPIPTPQEFENGHYWTLLAQENRRGAPSFIPHNGGCPDHRPPTQNYDICTTGLLAP